MLSWLFPDVASLIIGFIAILYYKALQVDLPERDTQDALTNITNQISLFLVCVTLSEYSERMLVTSAILMWEYLPSVLLGCASSCYLYAVLYGTDHVCLGIYLCWILYWIAFINSLGRILRDFSLLPVEPRKSSRPKHGKHRRKRRPRFPFHRRRWHRRCYYQSRRSAREIGCPTDPLSDWGAGWSDDSDPLQGRRAYPYWRTLHTSILPDLWDDVCKLNPDIITMSLGGDESYLARFFSDRRRTMPLAFSVGSSIFDLTKATSVDECFRFQSIFYVQEEKRGAPIIFDSGASVSITPYLSDFVDGSLNQSVDAIGSAQIQGISASTAVKGVGKIRLIVYTDTGAKREIVTQALFVPQARIRLLSVCRYRDEHRGQRCSFVLDDDGCRFTLPLSIGGGTITFNYRDTNYIPKTTAYAQRFGKSIRQKHNALMVLDNSNVNLTAAQKELLRFHFCLGHFNMGWIQRLITKKILHTTVANVTSKNAQCPCMACQLAKQTRRPEGTTKQSIRPEKDGGLKKGHLRPGSMVSTDQFVSSLPGRLPNTYGRERESDKYVGGTVFVDEASGYFSIHNQVSLGAASTVQAKHSFERDAIRHGVTIQGYRGDNGVYKSDAFREDLKRFNQTLDLCGVGAHHQNGVAERAIRTVSSAARAMMLHAMIHWPEQVTLDLWPFAINYAVYLWNRIPRGPSDLSPQEIFFNSTSDHQELRMSKVWGCPSYVLDPRMQDGKKLPRWNPRSKMGQFLGRSSEHAGSIGLIRNLRTNAVTAQFHVVYDNHFSTVSSDWTADNVPVPPGFHNLMRFSCENHIDPADQVKQCRRQLFDIGRGRAAPGVDPGQNRPSVPEGGSPPSPRADPLAPPSRGENSSNPVPFDPAVHDPGPQGPAPSFEPDDDSSIEEEAPPSPKRGAKRSSPRLKKEIPRGTTRSGKSFRSLHADTIGFGLDDEYLSYVIRLSDRLDAYDAFLVESDLDSKSSQLTRCFEAYSIYQKLDWDLDITTGMHPLAFSARANAEDTPRFHEAMRSPDREGFIEAMKKEMIQLAGLDAFVAVPRQKAIDAGKQIVDVTWAFKRKRFPDGSVKKLKARLCVRGDLQITDAAFDTYSPVVQWTTVRLLLILSIIFGFKTKQVDFTLAFVQAKAEPGTFIEMPRMFEKEGYILELKRNLYGQRDSPIKFYEHLKVGLEQRGFKASSFDPCLFYSDTVIILVYVDDCIMITRQEKHIDNLIDSLRSGKLPNGNIGRKYFLDVEGDYAGFLGIDISKSEEIEGAIELLQTGLIDWILAALNLDDDSINTCTEPAASTPLGKDENGPGRKEHWSYPSVIGMMLYLASNSRPDIAYAVNQCARFNHCAKLSHEKAVKRIGRYLKLTRDTGLVMKPNDKMNLELYADADFAGLWSIEHPDDPISVRSRTGYIITLCGLPISWSSKLQTEIATSTMMAEYIALSTGMRELLPTIDLFREICDHLKIERTEESKVVRAFEDNEGALKLAVKEMPRYTPQSKHFGVKYHWFRSKLNNPDYNIKILPIDTSLQLADIFTKGLGKVEFQKKRRLLMGW